MIDMFAVVRIRSSSGRRKEVRDTLGMLRLKAPNNCVIVPEMPDFKGMLNEVRNAVTWGEVDKETLVKMLEKRLRLRGRKRIDIETLKKTTGFESFESLADGLMEGKAKLSDFEKIDSVLRLTPPSKGFKSVRTHYPKGDLGYRGKEINGLLKRMI